MSRAADEPVRLTSIYTRGGDAGETSLGDGSRVSKLDARIGAYGATDELNSLLGVVLAGECPAAIREALVRIQNELFDVGADLCRPVVEADSAPHLRIEPAYIQRLERWCDTFNAPLLELSSFVLRGGTPAGAAIHVACTVTRRAERSTWAAIEEHGSGVNVLAASYLNRLSDLLFVLARYTNRHHGDVLWEPGRALDL